MSECLSSVPTRLLFVGLLCVATGSLYALDTGVEEASCRDIGFKPKTEKFAKCVLELYGRKNESSPQAPPGGNQKLISQGQQRGDGSQDDQTCQKYGLKPGQPEYGNCRMQIDMARAQAEREQARYEAELAAYEEEKNKREAAIKRQRADRALQLGLGMLSGQITVDDFNRANLGLPPAPKQPSIQNQTIRLPGGNFLHCTTTGSYTHCN